MRRIITSLSIMLLLLSYGIRAQDISVGVKGGVNFSTLGGDAEDVRYNTGIHIGGYAFSRVSGNITIQSELYFSQQGAKSDIDINLRTAYSYLNLPILLKFYLRPGFQIHTGPQIGFLLSGKIKDGDVEQDISEQLNKTDVSLALGTGYEFDSGFNFNARFNFGLNSTADNPGQTNMRFTNQVFQISGGYTF